MAVAMSYNFDVIRGWPNDAALESTLAIASGQTLSNGDVVKMSATGLTKAGAAEAGLVGFVIRGNGDSVSANAASKAIVLWSNLIAKANVVKFSGASLAGIAVGDGLKTAAGGLLAKGAIGTDPIVAYVIAVGATDVTIVVK